ncbi:MAG: UvrD-helicase domain-containing protein [Verrucomicrobia bacterium]|nr:UvrD-helicase domain-containing protein [Verrucomicrobiota bacterium]
MRNKRAGEFESGQLALFANAPDPSRIDDRPLRARFIRSVEENFSIIAPAGVGKTQSIVERIVSIARHKNAGAWLPRLVVVTFTKRAADEMQQRAREEILRAQVSLEVLEQFNRAFFGTIHSFCVELLRDFGHHLGLPAKFELVEQDDELWLDFLHGSIDDGAPPHHQHERFYRHTRLQNVLRLGRTLSTAPDCSALPKFDELRFDELLAHPASGRCRESIAAAQALVHEWQRLSCEDERYLPLPRFSKNKGGEAFQRVWQKAFAPFREWLCGCALRVAGETAQKYRDFRVGRGLLTYDDQVTLAGGLLRHPIAARQIREREYRVILDEAQDTDREQFYVLLECTRPVDASGEWQTPALHPPVGGRFCIVGDPQQSIYSARGDLARYASIRELLRHAPAGDELAFTTTFRCDNAIIDFVNATFPRVFVEPEQVEFVPLEARANAGAGQIVRFEFDTPPDLDPKLVDRKRAIIEADAMATWLLENGLRKLRASSWSEVAILAPQKRWFSPLRIALRKAGLRTQVQSPRDIRGDSPAYAWLTALLIVAANPQNAFEIFGLLRELFGISDHDLAHFARGNGCVFQIDRETEATGAVADALNVLTRTRREILGQPLRDGVEQLISATNLRARLAAIPEEYFENSAPELDALVALASSAEADGQTLNKFAETLRKNFGHLRETRPAESDAIQLVTCHKAKGLQWDAVILPFFHRRQYPRPPKYPRLIHRGSELPAIVALEGDDISPETKQQIETRERQERERLLYVSLTRARRTVVIADDEELFCGNRNLHRHSLAAALKSFQFAEGREKKWISSPGPNHSPWRSLGRELAAEVAPDKADGRSAAEAQHLIAAVDRARALRNADQFPRRILPSSFVTGRSDEKWRLDREPEWREPAPGSAAIAYGKWWHEFMQSLPWRDPEAQAEHFGSAVQTSPDGARSAREWNLFHESNLAQQIAAAGSIIHAEMPLLWAKTRDECVEGVIDLAVLNPAAGEWLVIDWKTDDVETSAAGSLQAAYGGQISAYVEALGAVTQQNVRGGLYSTSTGMWLPV